MSIQEIKTKQTTFLPEYTHDEKISMLQKEIEKAKRSLSGLFKRCGELKQDVEFYEGVLEDIALETIGMS